jgi:hypothetical protein
LLFATYFGGNGSDSIRAIALDPAGNIYLTGATSSGDLPAKSGSYQAAPGDAFIANSRQMAARFLRLPTSQARNPQR